MVLFAGLLGGTVLAPMRLIRTWHWDHAWGFYVCNAYFMFLMRRYGLRGMFAVVGLAA